MKEQEFQEFLKANSEQLIIFGTGMMGEHVYQVLKQLGISVAAFCDNNMEVVGCQKSGIPICSFAEIREKYESPTFLISLLLEKYQLEIAEQLEEHQIFDHYSLLDCWEKIESFQMPERWMDMIMEQRSMQKYRAADSELTYMDHFGVDITEICNLRCKGCMGLIPSIQNPIHRDKQGIMDAVDRIAEILDQVVRFDLVGGETLMHPNIYELIAYAQSKQNFDYVNIYTNGTIVPKKEELMKLDRKRLLFYVSNYGAISNKKQEIIELLEELEIGYHCPDEMHWYESKELEFRNKTVKELEQTFKYCDNDCPTFRDGKFFYCFKALDIYTSDDIPKSESLFVEMMDRTIPIQQTKKEMRQLLYGQKYLKACNWCVGGLESERTPIPAGIQL